MKKLIAQRPIQYMGRTYERGEAIPAQDPKMVAAWLKANSAAWTGTDVEDAARAAIREAARRSRVNDQAAEAIRNAYQMRYVMSSISTELSILNSAIRGQ